MKIKYFQQTDTLYIELRKAEIVETRDLDENTQIDPGCTGKFLCDYPRTRERADGRAEPFI